MVSDIQILDISHKTAGGRQSTFSIIINSADKYLKFDFYQAYLINIVKE